MARRELSGPAVPFVTSLPAGVDGQVIDYLADAANGVVWRFRYRLASAHATYKWEFVGGSSLYATFTGQVDNTNTAFAFVAGYVSFALPLAGVYDCTVEVVGYNNTANQSGIFSPAIVGQVAASDGSGATTGINHANAGSATRTSRITNPVAGSTLRTESRVTGTSTTRIYHNALRAMPVRVG